MIENLLASVELLMRFDIFLMIGLGLVLGMLVGALPGLTTVMALSILLPVSFFLDPLVGIPFLIGVYKGGVYGGSIPAILLAVPGTGAAIVTTFDGPALTRKGKARKALEMALYSSVIGDFSSDVITLLLIMPIALVALMVGPPELAAILILSLIVIATSGRGDYLKGLLMMALGLAFAVVGLDGHNNVTRFTFDVFELRAGIPILPMLIGLVAIPEILLLVERRVAAFVQTDLRLREGERLLWSELRASGRTIVRSTGIGTVVGMVPGVGQVVASILAYAAAKQASPHPERFGEGELEGIAASETANNAVNGPTMVPMLTLGIPGDISTAVLLGAFIAQGLRPGPELMVDQAPIVFAILLAMIAANVLFMIIGYLAIPYFAKIVTIRKSLLLPLTIIFAFAGAYSVRGNPNDLLFVFGFGAFGYLLRKADFDVAPLVMAFVLAPSLENSVGQTVDLAAGNILSYIAFERPIALVILVLTPFLSWWLVSRSRRLSQRIGMNRAQDTADNPPGK
jgi:putative tricarboxylic transport membrane protein